MSGTVFRDAIAAGVPAAILSGIPSTLHALVTGNDPLDATRAAGSMLLPDEDDPVALVAAAIPVHLFVSGIWALALAAVLPRKNVILEGTVAGVAIATLDLGILGRRYPRIRALPRLPQIADHIAFGIITAGVLARRAHRAVRNFGDGSSDPAHDLSRSR